jgi:DNA-binding NtrC family response regulator
MKLNGKSIVVVEDDAAMLRALGRILRGEGAKVLPASCAEDALESLSKRPGPFDLVITDLRLPTLDGKAVLDAVKASHPRVPVIIITAFGSPTLRTECLSLGAAAFLEKPVESATLLENIERALFDPPEDTPVPGHNETVL